MSRYTDDAAIIIEWARQVAMGRKPEADLDLLNRFEAAHRKRGSVLQSVAGLTAFVAGCTILGLVVTFGVQVFTWLKAGIWEPYPLSIIVGGAPYTRWVGVARLLSWVFDLHFLIPCVVATLIAAMIVYNTIKDIAFASYRTVEDDLHRLRDYMHDLRRIAANR